MIGRKAYAEPIDKQCMAKGCRRRATMEVFTALGHASGVYCRTHAGSFITYLNRNERKGK